MGAPMPLLEWRDEFAIGVQEVDYEHLELIRLINKVYANLAESRGTNPLVGAFLGEVHTKIAAHFALEEKVMRERRYGEYSAHKAEHEHLLNEIREIMDAYDTGGYVGLEDDLAQTLDVWFGRHFQTFDAEFHRAIAGKPGKTGIPPSGRKSGGG